MRSATPIPRRRVVASIGALVVTAGALVACADGAGKGVARVLAVPADYETIQDAVDAASPGDLVLIGPGTYDEQVEISTPDLTIRGTDRNGVVVDGGGLRPYGIVSSAGGIRIENLTVRRATFYGVLITGMRGGDGEPTAHNLDGYEKLDPERYPPLQRFGITHVTSANNGLYGLYVFDAQHGYIRDSYASGSADSGIYIGQCRDCDVLVQGNVAERNAVGFENANASDSVTVTGNRFAGNRIGLTLLSNYQEAFTPQRGNTVVGNAIFANDSGESPAHADGGFGIGVGVHGGQDNLLSGNLIAGNPTAGVLFTNTEDLPVTRNVLEETAFVAHGQGGNGIDVANTSAARAPATGNCVGRSTPAEPTALPAGFLAPCGEHAPAQPATDTSSLPRPPVPPGMSFLRVPAPPEQPTLPARDLATVPPPLPAVVGMPDLDNVPTPTVELLADRAALK